VGGDPADPASSSGRIETLGRVPSASGHVEQVRHVGQAPHRQVRAFGSTLQVRHVTIDLAPFLDAVPDAVVASLRDAKRVLAVSHENPDADTLGATLGVASLVEALGGHVDPVCTDPPPPLYDF